VSAVLRESDKILAAVAVGYLVAAAAVAVLMTWLRTRRGVPRGWARRASFAEVGMVAGTLPFVMVILSPTRDESRIVTPVDGLHEVFSQGVAYGVVQVVGNLLVFAAFGLLAPVRWRIGALTVLLIAAGASVILETLQYVLDLGRVTDIGDVILNGSGAGLAALVGTRLRRRIRPVQDCHAAEIRTPSVAAPRYGGRSTVTDREP
jgi:hypothetical protein